MKKTVVLYVLFCYLTAGAQVRLPRLVRDSMILQRDTRINVWGWARPGEKVTVKLNGKTAGTRTGTDGKWRLQLPPMPAGGPYTLRVDASNHLELKAVLIGEVWLCAGQSNMVHQMELHSVRYAADITTANFPMIRQFLVPNTVDLQAPQEDLPAGNWVAANPETVRQFSAVAYFFARDLYRRYSVPIGLINASYGGTPIESWISEAGLQPFPEAAATIEKNKDSAYISRLLRNNQAVNRSIGPDQGTSGTLPWYDTAYQPRGWLPITVPGYWEDQGSKDLDGVVWYRREITVPAGMAGQSARLFLGRIVDADVVYLNGKKIGNTTYLYPQRRYTLPAGLLQPGRNQLVVRVQNHSGKGGFVPDKPYYLATGNDTIDLQGTWLYKVGEVYAPPSGTGNNGITLAYQPAVLYNAMITPLIQYTIRGINWYQGESNTGRPAAYQQLLPALIQDWRRAWQSPSLPFLYVQLPGFMDRSYLPSESNWALLREAQLQTLSIPHTAMVVAIDLGEWNDIHPDRKREVGERLALAARQQVYQEKTVVGSSPLYRSARVDGNRIIVSFTGTGSGLVSYDAEPLRQFAIAGADKRFVWADARIEGGTVVVSSPAVPAPLYVRYAWADNPEDANLYNREGLPASPFRTDP